MKKLLQNKLLLKLAKIFFIVMGSLLMVFIAVLQAGVTFAPVINDFFGVIPWKQVHDENST